MQERVSVIVPVYKAEKYLADCMSSILKQDYSNMEIILVEDGSPGQCPEICNRYAEKYANVQVVHQMNKGVGESRNTGLSVGTVKYVFFVDADDCLDGNHAITVLVQAAEENDADIVVGSFRKVTEAGCSDVNYHHLKPGEYTKTVDFRFKGFLQYGHLGFCWGKCYKKEFLEKNNIRYANFLFGEDKAMNMCCCACDPVYAFVDESVYLYRSNDESVSYIYRDNLMEIWNAIAVNLQEFMRNSKMEKDYNDMISFHVFWGIFAIMQQEIQSGNTKTSVMTAQLKRYGKNRLTSACIKELLKKSYIFEIESRVWRVLIWMNSVVFLLRGYFGIALGFNLLNATGLAQRIVNSKYKKR